MNRANPRGHTMDDKEIIALYLNRDEKALEYTAEKYDSYCYAIALRILGSEEDAKECVNDALLAVWETIPPNQPEKLSLYLGRITKNISVNKLRAINAKKRGEAPYQYRYELSGLTDHESRIVEWTDKDTLPVDELPDQSVLITVTARDKNGVESEPVEVWYYGVEDIPA